MQECTLDNRVVIGAGSPATATAPHWAAVRRPEVGTSGEVIDNGEEGGAAVTLSDVRGGLRRIGGVLRALSAHEANVGLDDDPEEAGAVSSALLCAARDEVGVLLRESAAC